MSKLEILLKEFLNNSACSEYSDRDYLPTVEDAVAEFKAEIKREVLFELLELVKKL